MPPPRSSSSLSTPPPFRGYSPAGRAWLRGIVNHNDRAWFAHNRTVYDREVLAPTRALAHALTQRLARSAPAYAPRDWARALHRIHRDVRFSADKTPYKTSMGLGFGHGGAHKGECAGFWVYVAATGVDVYGGAFTEGGLPLARLRNHVAANHRALAGILRRPTLRRVLGVPRGPRTQRIPSGFERDHPAGDWLCFRGMHLVGNVPAKTLASRTLPTEIFKQMRLMLPFVEFLQEGLD